MRNLITGGAGFVGSHLADALLKRGDEVVIIDDLSTGSTHNIEHLQSSKSFRWIFDSVVNRRLMAELVDDVDRVFHLAAAVGVKLIVQEPVRTIETNIKATEITLEMAAKKKKKVVLTSTSEVYGKSAKDVFREDDDLVLGPTSKSRWSYACSKALDEFLALAFHRERGVPVVIARLFNTVGPRQTGTYGMVLPRFVNQALEGKPITVYGSGEQSRCFGWVGDVVKVLIMLTETTEAEGKIFNVGSNEEITIMELAHLVKEVTQSSSPIVTVPYDQAYEEGFEDMTRRKPDLRAIRNLLGYQPSRTIREIVEEVIQYRRHHRWLPVTEKIYSTS